MKIGQNIKKLREINNLTQQQMADKLSISQNGYGKIERDETDIQLSKIKKIAQILGVEVTNLIDFDKKAMILNVKNSNNQTANAYIEKYVDNDVTQILKEFREIYENRILDLQNEILRLHTLLEKHILK